MRLIDADALFDDFKKTIEECKKWEKDAKDSWTKTKAEHAQQDFVEAVLRVKAAPTVDAVPVCRCAECKHRPTKPDDYNPITTDGFALEFPDEKCPCQCSDGWYSKYPDDDWYCPIGERKGEDEEAAK